MSKREWKDLWRLLREIAGREKGTMVGLVFLALAEGIGPYISILGMGFLLDGIYAGAGAARLFRLVLLLALGVLACALVEGRTEERFNQKLDYTKDLESRELNETSLSMDYEYLEDPEVGTLRSRAFARSYFGIRGWYLLLLRFALKQAISILAALGVCFPLLCSGTGGFDGWFALLCLSLGGLIWINCRAGFRCTREANRAQNAQMRGFHKKQYLTELLSGAEAQKDLRINRQQSFLEAEMEALCAKLQEGQKRVGQHFIRRGLTDVLVSGLSGFLVYLFAGVRAWQGAISVGDVVVCASCILQMSRSINTFSAGMGSMKQMASYAADYLQYRNLEEKKYRGTIPVEKRRDNRFSVSFEHVSFRYPGAEKDVLHDLNLTFEIGEKMAIVGKNGSGKSTFIKLLCRLYDVTEGCIKVNGIDIRKYDYQEYCDLFAVVFQDFGMFAFSVEENIACAQEAEAERLEDALRRAGLWERLQELPEGTKTYVGKEFRESGVAFSGGEKQKMAIARAIYKDAAFVIMDEPTAALDPLAECQVYAGFDQMVGKKTALYISHRLASCRFCEDILVFDQGQVVQRGSHEELKEQEGLYRELWNAQAQYYA